MSLAELHGKLSPQEESAEDLLTSEVFEALDVIGESALLGWLGQASAIESTGRKTGELRDRFPTSPSVTSWGLWPWFPSVLSNVPGCEPDAVFQVGRVLILVEMKYLSGLSGEGVDEMMVSGVTRRLDDQLGRQWVAGYAARYLDLRPKEPQLDLIGDWAVVFVTQNWEPPVNEFSRSIEAILQVRDNARDAHGPEYSKEDARSRLYWLNYQTLHRVLRDQMTAKGTPSSSRACDRLRRLLERKGFRSFEGVSTCHLGPASRQWKPLNYEIESHISWPRSSHEPYRSLEWEVRFTWWNGPMIDSVAGTFYKGGSDGKRRD